MHCNYVEKKDSFILSDSRFKTAFSFLKRSDLDKLEDQTILLDCGEKAIIQSYKTSDSSTRRFETHEKFYDIQYIISGCECMYICDKKNLTSETGYIAEQDIEFYKNTASSDCIILEAGKYVFLDKDDAHKPGCSFKEVSDVRKVVIKIPIKL